MEYILYEICKYSVESTETKISVTFVSNSTEFRVLDWTENAIKSDISYLKSQFCCS